MAMPPALSLSAERPPVLLMDLGEWLRPVEIPSATERGCALLGLDDLGAIVRTAPCLAGGVASLLTPLGGAETGDSFRRVHTVAGERGPR